MNRSRITSLRTPSILVAFAAIAAGSLAWALHEKNAGPQQFEIKFKLPPPKPLSPEEALKSFKVPKGFRVELVAAEPMVEVPVAQSWDEQGRMFVCEMRGYMHDVEGKGEDQPIGRIVILEDTDGDGKMDKRTVFADGLVLPRAVVCVNGGALVSEPPVLWFMKDTDGDGDADVKEQVDPDVRLPRRPAGAHGELADALSRQLDLLREPRHPLQAQGWKMDLRRLRPPRAVGHDAGRLRASLLQFQLRLPPREFRRGDVLQAQPELSRDCGHGRAAPQGSDLLAVASDAGREPRLRAEAVARGRHARKSHGDLRGGHLSRRAFPEGIRRQRSSSPSPPAIS